MRLFLITFILFLASGFVCAQEQTPYDIALERIREAEQSGATHLDLSRLGLTELPSELWNLTNLRVLLLYENQLSILPSEIGNLTDLQRLDLCDNQLNNIPPEIGNLSKLISLSLDDNQLDSIPSEIGQLDELQELFLDNNQLISIPSEIGNITNLRILWLIDNQLNNLPSEIGQLSNLCELYLQNNQLRQLPTELGQITNFRDEQCVFHVNNNPLISPPPEVIAQGTPAILDYLENQAGWHLQRLFISITTGIVLLATLILGLRYRQRRNGKPKQKRSN